MIFGDSNANNFIGRITRGVEALMNFLWFDYFLSLTYSQIVVHCLFCCGPTCFISVQLYQHFPWR